MLNRIISPTLFFFAFIVASFSYSQSPGGVSTNLHLWFKANLGAESDGIGTAANNLDPVQIWQDQSGNNFDANQTDISGSRPLYSSNVFNGNPALIFDGNDDFFPINNLTYPTDGVPSAITVYGILATTNTGEGVILSYDRNEYFRFASDHNNDTGFGLSTTNSAGTIDDFNATSAIEIDGVPHILGGSYNSGTAGINKFLYFDGTVNNSTDAGNTAFGRSTTTRYGFIGVGSEESGVDGDFDDDLGPTNYLEGSFAELFYYEDELTNIERQRVESYLALKYGITLSTDSDGDAAALETGEGINEGDYVTSAGTAVWDASANVGYNTNIAGVGRDDGSALLQTSSQSINSASVFALTETTFNDDDFIIWGNNNSALSTSVSGSSFDRELDRVWKIQPNTTNVSDIDEMTFDLSSVTVLPDNLADFALLVDSDEDFSDATVISPTSFTSDILTFDNVDLSGVTFFTIGYNLSSPAGIDANLAFWFRADAGTEEAAADDAEDGDQVRFWRDQSGNGFDGTQTTIVDRPRFDATNTINGNPVLTFDGGSNMNIANLNYDITTNTLNELTIFAIVKSTQADEGIVVSYDRSSFYRFALNHNNTPNFGLSTTVEGSADEIDDNNANTSASDGFPHLIGGDYTTITDAKNLYLDGSIDATFAGAHGATGGILGDAGEVPRYGFIAANSEANDPTDGGGGGGIVGDVAEIIYFEGLLNATELARIQSYLAVKYGITLSTDYVASDGTTVIWDNSANTGYNAAIAGVGLDATATLNQTQSGSETDGSVFSASVSGLSDGDYILWGSDNGDLSIDPTATGDQGSRFNRTWKVQLTGGTSSLTQVFLDISSIVVKPEALANYSLVLDDVDDFSTTPISVTPADFTGGILRFDNVNLSGVNFITLALTEDLDNDGVADATDLDDDNDGILDTDEGSGAVDTDLDGIVDSRDLDSDNDGIGDLYEATTGTTLSSLDSNSDGVLDGAFGANGLHNSIESDDTGAATVTYGAVSNYETTIDAGGVAGPPDFRDVDTDNNGISDLVESGRSTATDTDDDGVFEGADADQDGIPDEIDAQDDAFGSTLLVPNNQDGTGEPDFRDVDNDDDGTNDITEVGLTDADADGMLDGSTDADGDGVLAERDDNEAVFAQINIASLVTGSGTDWYSYRSGDWTDPDNWTTDPSGTTRTNPGSLIPNNFVDNVTILNGDEMTLNFDGLVISSLVIEEGGVINIGTTINHNFNNISGQGALSLASDEFPGGTLTDFVASSGGTVIYTDQSPAADYELTVDRTFNNLIINSVSNTITLKSNLTLNGDLTVASGTLQINDNTADAYVDNTTPLDILINGNLTVDAAGSITVGNVDAATQIGTSGIFNFHEIELLGDMTNNGSVSFTNVSTADDDYRDMYPTAADSDNGGGIPASEFGAVEVLFTNGLADQLVTLNGPTDFYRIEVAKGTSQTFVAEFNASDVANFRLLGRIAMRQSDDSGDTPNIANHRALGLEAGILKLGTNIVIDEIAKEDNATTQGGNRNYIIDLDAQLWLAENSVVTKAHEWGFHPFGRLKISDNATLAFDLSGNGSQRTILVDNQGVFEMTGGTANVTQFRNKTGADGAPRGSFIMTGGTLNIGNGGVDGNHGILSVPWEEQNFVLNASDEANPPTINITLDGNRGKDNAAIQIGAADGNYDVGVSNINILHTNNADYKIVSTAPLYNLTYTNTGTGELIIDNIIDADDDPPGGGGVLPDDNSGTIPSPAQFALPLTITNDFTIADGRFDANDFDITVGNLFTINTGGEYDPGANTTVLNGSSPVQRLRLNGTDPLLGGFNNLSFTGSGTTKEFGGDLATITVLGDLSIGSGVTLDDDGKVVVVNGDISNSGIHETDFASPGRIELSGGAVRHSIGGDGNGRFEILTLDDVLGATFTASQQIDSVLNLVNGIMDINTNQLTINSTATDPIIDDNSGDGATNNFDATRMIQTAGNASDGGMSFYFDGATPDPVGVLFPIGTNANSLIRYTPVLADLSGISDDGFVQIRTSDIELQTVDVSAISNNILTYYWRVSNNGFDTTPTVDSYVFTVVDSDDPDAGATPTGLPTDFVPGKVLDESPFTRSQEDVSDISGLSITFDGSGSGFALENANYTAGDGTSSLFTGSPEIYYNNIATGNSGQAWDAASSWFTDEDRTIAATDFPQAGDIAVIGGNNFNEGVTVSGTQEAAEVIFDRQGTYNDLEDLPRLRFSPTDQLTVSKVSGVGDIYLQRNLSSAATLNADIGDFAANDLSLVQVYMTQNGSYAINDGEFFNEFPSLRIYGQLSGYQRDITFNYDFTAKRLLIDGQGTLVVGGNYTIEGETDLGFTSYGRIQFPNGTESYTFTTDSIRTANNKNSNDINLQAIEVIPGNANNVDHRLIVNGDFILDFFDSENVGTDNINIDLYNSETENNVILEFGGEGSHTFTNDFTAGQYNIELYRVVVNKGISQNNSISIDTDFTLSGVSNEVTKPINLQNGTLVLNNAGIDIDLNSGGGDFLIPETAGLTVQAGTVRVTSTGIGAGNGMRLNGKLTVSGGDVILDGGTTADNYIEYGTGGAAEIEVTGGNLIVGSQLRRNILSSDGVINYTQTDGTALFGANVAPEDSRGVFEIINTGTAGTSSFNLSGATSVFAIVHGQAAPVNGTFIIGEDVAVNVAADAVIDFGYNDTPIATTYANDLNEMYQITSSGALPNIRIDNANNNAPVVELIIQPLTVTDNLEILNGGSLIANGFDLTVNNGFTNNGTYTPGANTTTFNGAVQTIAGTTATTFNNLVINPATSLTLANIITVNGDMDVQSGTFDDNGNRVSLDGNLSVSTNLISDGSGTGGISMDGTTSQSLSLPSGAATIDKLIINNPNGIDQLENGGAATILTINDELALDNGLWNLGDNRLIFDPDALVTSSTGFDETKMISVNGVKRSDGVERQFLSANGDVVAFTLPVGTPDKYTPVILDVDGSNDDGSLLVKPINSVHPSADATLTGPTDELDALNYYWLVTTNPSSVTGFSGSVSFQYLEEDANNPGQNESTWENNAARLIAPNWFKPSGNLVDITNNLMTFTNADLSSFGGTSFDGEFTIGNDIPDELAQYRSNTTGAWSTATNWDIESTGDGLFDDGNGVPQPGTVVIVNSGDEITMSSGTDNDQNIFSLQIDGTLDVNDSDGHNFGDITGTGTLRISNPTLPGGNYDNFFLTTGGALDLAGASGYTISPDFASGVRGLTVSGGGTKVLPAISVNVGVGGISILDNATLSNANNNDIVTTGDVTINTTGTMNLGTAAASLTAANFNLTAGSFATTGASIDLSGDLVLSNGTFNSGSGTHTIGGDFTKTSGSFVNDNGTITFDGGSDQNLSGDFTSELFNNLSMSKSGGELVLSASSVVNINNTLTLGGGNINTNASGAIIRLLNGVGSISGSTGFINGPMQADLNANDVFSFPVGKGTFFKPLQIDIASQSANPLTWEAEYNAGSAATFTSAENDISGVSGPGAMERIETNSDADEQVITLNESEYWRIDSGTGTATVSELTLDISNSGISADDINDQLLQVMVWDDANTEWDHLGGVSSGTPTSANVVSTVSLGFSEKIVISGAESNLSLPVELISFSGEIVDNVTRLSWETASEINNDYFEVQHSLDGISFETVGVVDGNGNTSELVSYSFEHDSPAFGENYYRLRQVDFDGEAEIHETLWLQNDFVRSGIDAIIYPNPGRVENLRIRLSSGDNHTPVVVSILDLSGKTYFRKSFNGNLNVDEPLEVGERMIPGIYFVEISQGAHVKREKLIIR